MNSPTTKSYWSASLKVLAVFLFAWFVVGLGLPVLVASWLNRFSIGGLPLGSWFAFQGAFIFFILVGFLYSRVMDRLDDQFRDN